MAPSSRPDWKLPRCRFRLITLYTNYTALLNQTATSSRRNIHVIHAHQIAGLKVASDIQELLVPNLTVHGMFYPRRRLQGLIDSCAHVAVSPPAARWARTAGVSTKQLSVIPNGIDINHLGQGRPNFKQELGMGPRRPSLRSAAE